MRDINSNIFPRRQNIERQRLEPIVGAVSDAEHAEPAFSDRLCKVIVEYWRRRGHQVRAWVESEVAHVGRIYVIRTCGIPVRLA